MGGGLKVSTLQQVALVFGTALVPTLGSTVAIPTGVAMGLHPVLTWAVAVAGALCKVPLAIALAGGFRFAAGHLPRLAAKLERMESRAAAHLPWVRRWGFPAVVLLAAVPVPGGGIWTAAVAGRLLGYSRAMVAMALALGLMIAGTGMTLAAVGIIIPVLSHWLR